jgi:putative hydrolase of HD superfamily
MKMENLIELFFKAANMERWNDHIRPVKLVELDKQAHKIIITYIIAKTEEDNDDKKIDWIRLIEKFLFEFFYRTVLTDLKPPIFHKMMEKKKEELDYYVLENLKLKLSSFNEGFMDRFQEHIKSDKNTLEDKIIKAAHYLATNWEFKIIYNAGPFIYGIDKTKSNIENQIEDYYDLIGVQKILLGKKIYGFMDLCGQLRFQKRWAHTPRVPETSVLGHMLVVAATSYFFTINSKTEPCEKKLYNSFFGGLFHDLPEVMTKDIISPIKKSVKGLDELIKEYENYQMEKTILPLIPRRWANEILYFTENEFDNKVVVDNEIKNGISFENMNKYNEDKYSPIEGQIIEVSDKLAAFTEAIISIRHGVTSKELEKATEDIEKELSQKNIPDIDITNVYQRLRKLINE